MINISKKTVLISSILTIAVAVPTIYYLSTRDQDQTQAWYDSSWGYRKAVTIDNDSGGTLTDEEVLIEMDTSTLISNSKLNSDCSDLRFVDEDDTTLLEYWIESGCNTTNTQVWVKIPSLTVGEYTIYSYYGNSSATSGEEAWDGEFILLSTVSCPSGWTRASEYDSKFPLGNPSYGATGGSNTHTHTITGTLSGATNYYLDPGGADSIRASSSHTHTFTITTSESSNVPPYLSMIFCTKNKNDIYEDSVILLDSETEPAGWSQFSTLNNSFPMGSETYGLSGGSSTNSHTTPASTTDSSVGTTKGAPDEAAAQPYFARVHTHSLGASTTSTDNSEPPYYTINFAIADSEYTYPSTFISMAKSVPPLGWTSFEELDERFPKGSTTSGSEGGAETHTHTGSVTIGSASSTTRTYDDTGGNRGCRAHNHNATYSYTTSTANNLPEYVTTVFIERKTSLDITIGTEITSNARPNQPSSLLVEGATDPSKVIDTTPEFSAIFSDSDASDTGVYYQIVVYNDYPIGSGTLFWDSGKQSISPITNGTRSSDISYAGTTLETNGETYYWAIKFWDNNGDDSFFSSWSFPASFTMNNAPSTPTSLYTDGSTNNIKVTDLTPEFSAIHNDLDSDAANYYEIEVNTNNTFTGTIMWDTGQVSMSNLSNGSRSSDVSYAGTTLTLNSTTYYWRIRFWDTNGTVGEWGTSSFTMSGPPNAPTVLYTDGMTNPKYIASLTPSFTALHTDPNGDSANSYEIEVNTNTSFTGTVMWDTGKVSMTSVSNNTRTGNIVYAGTTLSDQNDTLYWRMRVWDTDDYVSEWSEVNTFPDYLLHMYLEGLRLEGIKIN